MGLTDYIFNPDMRKIKIDFPSSCNANCIGCYAHSFEKDQKNRLPLERIIKALDDALNLGIKQLIIAADGEPLIDQDYFFSVVEHATQIGMETVIYTNGSLITSEIAKRLYALNTSLFVKRNSMNHQRQNEMLRVNLSENMIYGICNLISECFNHKRLALQSYVSKANEKDLDDVLRFCRRNLLMPYFEEFICINQPLDVVDKMVMTPEQLLTSFKRYQQIDREQFGIQTQIVPGSRRYGIEGCSFNGLMSVDTDGNVKRCIFNAPYGNIFREELKEIYARIPGSCCGCSASVLREL